MAQHSRQSGAGSVVNALTGLLIGALAGLALGAAVAAGAGALYLLSWLTIVGVPIGYLILMAGVPHGFWAAWAASAAGGLVGGIRSGQPGCRATRDLGVGAVAGIPVALLVLGVRIAVSGDPAWRRPAAGVAAVVVALIAGIVGGGIAAAVTASLGRRRHR